MKKVVSVFLAVFMLSLSLPVSDTISYAAEKPVVVVIDPGHGGEGGTRPGAMYNGFIEKDITLRVANALKSELEKYDNITVKLTRTSDVDMSLENRAEFAKKAGADFMYSIHFNASEEHSFYGSEVWTSAFGNYYKKGYEFGQIISTEWSSLGLYQKGIKTKIGSSGKDYYGVIRQSTARGIPCVILEHTYLDHSNDVSLLKTDGFFNRLAAADATAIAKYFKLKAKDGSADYSSFSYKTVKKPSNAVRQDTTDPDTCNIKILATDPSSGNILVEMTAKDKQSPIIYFSYSYDGGKTFCPLQMWDRSKETQSFNVKVPSGTTDPVIDCRAYNNYELFTQSAVAQVSGSFNY